MANDLRINIVGTLNDKASTLEINKVIKTLESKIEKLQLNVALDDKVVKTLADFSKAMENHKKIAQDLNRVIKEEKKVIKEADGTTKEYIRQHLKSGEIIEKEIEKINKRNKALQQEQKETGKLVDEIDKLNSKRKESNKYDSNGNLKSGSQNFGDKFNNTTYKYDSNKKVVDTIVNSNPEQQARAVEKLKQKVVELNNAGVITASSMNRMTRAIDGSKTEAEISKIEKALKRVQNSSSSREQTKQLEHQLELYRKQAEVNAQNLRRRYGSALGDDGNRALNSYVAAASKITAQTPNAIREMDKLKMQFREISSNVRSATSHVLSFGQQLQIAMSRIPVWMTGMTMFYLPLRGLQDAVRQIIEIDSQLTVLERVSNGQMDVNDTLRESIALAEKLGNTIQQVNEGMISFAKQGFRGDDLTLMTEYATLLGNISDMSVEESASTITAAVKGLNLEIKESLHVINALNEVDNNFSVSTQDLATSLMKSAGAANVYGVSLEKTLGYTTAIGQVSRESGSVIGNSLKSIYSRITSIQPAIDAMKSIGVEIKTSSGEMRNVDDILENLAGKWKGLSKEQQQNLGLQIAGKLVKSASLVGNN